MASEDDAASFPPPLFSAAFWKRAWMPPGLLGFGGVALAEGVWLCVAVTSLVRKPAIPPAEEAGASLNLLADRWSSVRGGDLRTHCRVSARLSFDLKSYSSIILGKVL